MNLTYQIRFFSHKIVISYATALLTLASVDRRCDVRLRFLVLFWGKFILYMMTQWSCTHCTVIMIRMLMPSGCLMDYVSSFLNCENIYCMILMDFKIEVYGIQSIDMHIQNAFWTIWNMKSLSFSYACDLSCPWCGHIQKFKLYFFKYIWRTKINNERNFPSFNSWKYSHHCTHKHLLFV